MKSAADGGRFSFGRIVRIARALSLEKLPPVQKVLPRIGPRQRMISPFFPPPATGRGKWRALA
jgi:hypothetical protein